MLIKYGLNDAQLAEYYDEFPAWELKHRNVLLATIKYQDFDKLKEIILDEVLDDNIFYEQLDFIDTESAIILRKVLDDIALLKIRDTIRWLAIREFLNR